MSNSKDCPLSLTVTQQECVFLLVRGKAIKEIAYILGLSNRTVEYYIEAIKHFVARIKFWLYFPIPPFYGYAASMVLTRPIFNILLSKWHLMFSSVFIFWSSLERKLLPKALVVST